MKTTFTALLLLVSLLLITGCDTTDAMEEELTPKEKCEARGGYVLYHYPVAPGDKGWRCWIPEKEEDS